MSLAIVIGVLVLHPVLDAEGPVRLVAVGVGDEPVRWVVDHAWAGTTRDGEPLGVRLGAGPHVVEAQSAAAGAWQALARPDPEGASWQAVPAWTARLEPGHAVPALPSAILVAALALCAAIAKRS